MRAHFNVLIMGASYGSLLATKLLLAGHAVKLVCLPAEAELINQEGTRVRLPVKGRDAPIEIDSRRLPGTLSAAIPEAVDPARFDLVALAMQEPQYRAPPVRDLLRRVAIAKIPCMSIMNMPPLPYLARIPGLDVDACGHCYTDPAVWDPFDPCADDAVQPGPTGLSPTGGEAQCAASGAADQLQSQHDSIPRRTPPCFAAWRPISNRYASIRVPEAIELPVKLKVYDSVFVPLAKWSMLMTGNYRCIQKDAVRSIKDTVHGDLEQSRSVYNWVGELCRALGASEGDQVPFEKYANASQCLGKPSSAARAVAGGATHIERVDCLVRSIAAQKGMRCDAVDEVVAIVAGRLEANQRAA